MQHVCRWEGGGEKRTPGTTPQEAKQGKVKELAGGKDLSSES